MRKQKNKTTGITNKVAGSYQYYYEGKKTFQRNKLRARLKLISALTVVGLGLFFIRQEFFPTASEIEERYLLNTIDFRNQLRDQIGESILKNERIEKATIYRNGFPREVNINYTFDEKLQAQADRLLRRYKPDYAAIVVMDAVTGRILALSSYLKNGETENLALRATYPAASIFKIIPAAAALDKYDLDPSLKIHYNGGNHTLYRKNVMADTVNRWTRFVSLRDAFGRSINTAFARLTFNELQPLDLREYADKFYFDKQITTDFPIQMATAHVPTEVSYELAEVASGFNQKNKLSPVQGAMIAAAIADDGIMRTPYIVDSVENNDGEVLFEAQPMELSKALTKEGAQKLRELMNATVTHGTGSKSFRTLIREAKRDPMEIGGKTGSLTCNELKGKADWFIGYAMRGEHKIAVAAITVNQEYWTVKSAYLAKSLFQNHFKEIKLIEAQNRIKNENRVGTIQKTNHHNLTF